MVWGMWNLQVSRWGPRLLNKPPQCSLQPRDAGGRDVPNLFDVNVDIVMNESVPHSAYGLPVEGGHGCPDLSGYPFGGFAYNFNVTDYRILQFLGFHKC